MIEADVVPVLTGVVARLRYLKVGPRWLQRLRAPLQAITCGLRRALLLAEHPEKQVVSSKCSETLMRRLGPGRFRLRIITDPDLDDDLLGSAAAFSFEVYVNRWVGLYGLDRVTLDCGFEFSGSAFWLSGILSR